MQKDDNQLNKDNLNKREDCIKDITNEELGIIKLFRKVKDPALKESVKSILSFAATASKNKK